MNLQDIALYSFFFILLSWGSKRIPFLPLLCFLLGIAWGFFGNHPQTELLQTAAKIALVFFLFLESARLHIPRVFRYYSIRLPTLGFFVSLVMGTLVAKFLFPLSWIECVVLILPLLSIDARVTPSVFESSIPKRVAQMFNVEASFTGILAFLLLAVIHLDHPFHFFIGIFFPIIAGVGLGYVCGIVGRTALECGWAAETFFRGALFLTPFAIFAFCDLFHANGFIGVIAAGYTFGHTARALCDTLFDLSRRQGVILFYLIIIFFGIVSIHVLSFAMTLTMVMFALIFLFGVRFLAVLASLIQTQFQWKTAFYMTFLAPKGLIPIAALFLFKEYFSFTEENLMLNIVLTTIFFSILIHSLFAYPITQTYAQAMEKYPKALESLPTVSFPT
ncbi:MAG: cation:proton antiporter [Simkaniaceae bacterium]